MRCCWAPSPQRGLQAPVHSGALTVALAASTRPMRHRSGGTVATHKPLLCCRVRKDITYPELNQSHNCSNILVLGVVALGLCVHMQPCTPHPISMFFHCSNTATSPPPTSARRAASLPSPLKSCALCCALTSGAVSGRLPACAPCLGPTSPTFTVFT